MSKWSVTTLKRVRNVAIVVGIVGAFLVWLTLPWVLKNSSFIHVGSGAFGNKLGALIILPLPLFSLFHKFDKPEVHTDDPIEREKVIDEIERRNLSLQAGTAIAEALLTIGLMAIAKVLM